MHKGQLKFFEGAVYTAFHNTERFVDNHHRNDPPSQLTAGRQGEI